MPNTRRAFLASTAALATSTSSTELPLPTVRLGKHEVTRLILGSNPFSGGSHFNPILDRLMGEWMSPERIVELVKRCEQSGIRVWQLHRDRKLPDCLRRYRTEGGKMDCFLLSDYNEPQRQLPELVKMEPIGIAHHGDGTDVRFRARQMDPVRDYLKMVRDTGVMVGLSTHNPQVIDYVESKEWDLDYYMACLYRRSRSPEEIRAEFGEATVGEPYFEKDPERMCKAIRQTRKPCLAFKILAAGRATRTPQAVEEAFRFTFANIKPQDCVIVGIYPRFKDEIAQNAELTRRYGTAT